MSFNEFLFQFPLESNASIFMSANSRGGGWWWWGGASAARGMRVRLRAEQSRQPRSVPRSEKASSLCRQHLCAGYTKYTKLHG